MRFRLCCGCGDKTKSKAIEHPVSSANPVESTPQTTSVPPIINQQPKHVLEQSPIELDKITEVSVEESSVVQPVDKEITKLVSSIPEPTEQTPIKESTKEEPSHENSSTMEIEGLQFSGINEAQRKVLTEIRDLILADKAARTVNPLPIQANPPSNQKSNIEIITTINRDKLILNQIAQDLYQGTFKGSLFYILEGIIYDSSGFLNEPDKAAIKHVYNEAMTAMQRGMKEMAGGYSALNDQEAWNPPPGSAINTNFITRKGENAVMTFKYIGQGHFRSTYEGRDFVILNGKLLVDESFDEVDRQLIMQTYNNTLLGMQQGLLSMQKGVKVQKGSVNASERGGVAAAGVNTDGSSYAHASYNLGSGQETIRRMHALNNGNKRIGLLESGMMKQPQAAVVPALNRNVSQTNNNRTVQDDDEDDDDNGLWEIPNREPLFGPWESVGFDKPERSYNPKFFFPD